MSRITGLATGLDVDSLVEETMKAYQTKIDVVDQQKQIAEIQQELYRDVITDCRDFYSDYFDITKSDSILKSSNWTTTKFESSSTAVTVTGNANAEAGNYSVKVSQLASAATYTIDSSKFKDKIIINEVEIDLSTAESNAEKVELINKSLKDKGITAKYSEFANGIVITSDKAGTDQVINITTTEPKKMASKSKDELDASIKKLIENGETVKLDDLELSINSTDSNKIDIKVGSEVVISIDKNDSVTAETIKEKINSNEALKSKGITAEIDKDGNFAVSKKEEIEVKVEGKNCEAVITNANGQTYTVNQSTNKITLDGVTFEFNNTTSELNPAVITGKTDTKSLKDNIVKFVNDYNTLLEKLNKFVTEKRNSDYMPLTSEQKAEMSEKEIELWEEKVKEGQLSRDSDLKRIISGMKSAMSTMMGQRPDQFGLSLMGITLVSDYSGSKAGTLTIDEEKLDAALENNLEDVQKLFTSAGTKDSTTNKYSGRGIAYQLKDLFDKETQTSSGALLKKAGMEGESTVSNNTLSQKISKYKTKIDLMQSIFSRKQQALYTKYASLETAMNNLNSQISYLQSNLG